MTDQINPTAAPAKPRRGCFFYGCITGLVLLVIVVIAAVAGTYYVKKKINSLVENYTDAEPVKMPVVSMSKDDADKVKQRFNAFEQSLKDHKPTAPLVLTSDDINVLLAGNSDSGAFAGKAYVSLDGDKVTGQLSLPLDSIGNLKMFKGRYLNGSGTFNVSLHDGVLWVSPDSITVKGQQLPDAYMQGIRSQNFAAGWTNNPDATSVLNQIKEIEVKDSKMIVVPKSAQGSAEAAPKDSTSLSRGPVGAEEALVFEHRVTVGHAGQIIADGARPAFAAGAFAGMPADVGMVF